MLRPEDLIILSSEEYLQDFNAWNDIQNRFNLRCSNQNKKFPKHLILAALREFIGIAETYHIDSEKFPYVRVNSDSVTWQVDFHADKDECGPSVSIYDIYYSSRKKQILQRCYTLG